MNERKNHMKAQDVFKEKDYVFRKKKSFSDAFPEIETLRVKVVEDGPDHFHDERWLDEESASEFINCGRANCYNGGINLGKHLRNMIPERKTQHAFEDVCRDAPGSPNGKRPSGRPCAHTFKVDVSIIYR